MFVGQGRLVQSFVTIFIVLLWCDPRIEMGSLMSGMSSSDHECSCSLLVMQVELDEEHVVKLRRERARKHRCPTSPLGDGGLEESGCVMGTKATESNTPVNDTASNVSNVIVPVVGGCPGMGLGRSVRLNYSCNRGLDKRG